MLATLRTSLTKLHRTYRASGADLPYGDPLPAHGVSMEGYFWRLSDPTSNRVVIALAGVNQSADGAWSTLGLASSPIGFLRTVVHPAGHADPTVLGVQAGDAFRGSASTLRVDLGPDARLDIALTSSLPWPRRSFGGSSVFQCVPALNQYWHPWLLYGTAHGRATLGDQTWDIDGWTVYGEKNWGKEGFPDSWWWGQAHGFEDPGACVAFAGGEVSAGPLRTTVTGLVVLLGDGTLLRLGDPVVSPVRADVTDERWSLHGRSRQWEVTVDGSGHLDRAHVLPVPLPSQHRNVAGAIEHLGARMEVTVRRHGRHVWSGTSEVAALEHGGIARAQSELCRRGAQDGAVDAPPRVR